ncbi:MAG: hypothetical protein KA297_06325 [Kofleriaceae bacterium]|jgi:hypothetical protein|nr:hypothetical protein [Kofleriaceae bacterium]MBP6837102.1 hypothetical protein [Kofleriaceae bacterium]
MQAYDDALLSLFGRPSGNPFAGAAASPFVSVVASFGVGGLGGSRADAAPTAPTGGALTALPARGAADGFGTTGLGAARR